jgi:hypothetical protein
MGEWLVWREGEGRGGGEGGNVPRYQHVPLREWEREAGKETEEG